MTILWVLFFIFFTGDVQIVVQIVLDKGKCFGIQITKPGDDKGYSLTI